VIARNHAAAMNTFHRIFTAASLLKDKDLRSVSAIFRSLDLHIVDPPGGDSGHLGKLLNPANQHWFWINDVV
jgi:hypothetical protein